MSQQSLRTRTLKGLSWSALDDILRYGVSFVVGVILARLLSPSEYGVIGICTICITILNSIVDSGFSQAIIRKKDATDEDYNTMFIVNMVLSIFLFGVLLLIAPAIATFFDNNELVPIIRVMGVIIIINALSITQNTILTKKIDFKTKTKVSLVASMSSGAIGIGLAFAGYGVWALVWQHISRQVINTIFLWIYNRWIPHFSFSVKSLKYMWGFGWKMLAVGLLDNVWSQIYQIVVGKFYSPATLGQYSKAKEYANVFSGNIQTVVGRVTYPVLSEIQNEKERLISAYRKIIKNTMFVTAISMLSLGAIAEPLLYCMIGPKWHEAAAFLPLICISRSLYPLHAINLNMLKVQGRSDLFLKLEIIKKIISIGPICLGIFVGIYWMVASSIVTGVIAFFLNSYYSGKFLGYSSKMQIIDVALSYEVGIIIALSVYFLKFLPISYWIILPIQLVVGTIVFFVVCETKKPEEYIEIKGIVSTLFQKIKNH